MIKIWLDKLRMIYLISLWNLLRWILIENLLLLFKVSFLSQNWRIKNSFLRLLWRMSHRSLIRIIRHIIWIVSWSRILNVVSMTKDFISTKSNSLHRIFLTRLEDWKAWLKVFLIYLSERFSRLFWKCLKVLICRSILIYIKWLSTIDYLI